MMVKVKNYYYYNAFPSFFLIYQTEISETRTDKPIVKIGTSHT